MSTIAAHTPGAFENERDRQPMVQAHDDGPDAETFGAVASLAALWESALDAGASEGKSSRELATALGQLRAEIRLGEGTRARLFRPIRGPRRIRLPKRSPGDTSVRFLLTRDGRKGYARRSSQVSVTDLILCHPMRDFSRRHGQTNKPVAFYSRTVGDMVACESQLERRFALLADWHQNVAHIAAQPFTLDFPEGHELGSHTPDFVLISSCGTVVVVDVKWPSSAVSAETVHRHEIVACVLATAGMQHVVWSGTPQVITQNLAHFAAARVPDRLLRDAASKLFAAHRPGMRAGSLIQSAAVDYTLPELTGLVVLRRLLWDHQFTVDMSSPFTLDSEVRCS